MIPVSISRQALLSVLHTVSQTAAWRSSPATVLSPDDNLLAPRGSYIHPVKDVPIHVGQTGVSVTLSDLNLPRSRDNVLAVQGRLVRLPSHTPSGWASVSGTDNDDTIHITQNTEGNSWLEVLTEGRSTRMMLGRIAGIEVKGYGGDDTISVQTSNYYGGVLVDGGNGDDSMSAAVEQALRRGIELRGGNGNDQLDAKETSSAVLLEGGVGADRLSLVSHQPSPSLLRRLYGQDGDDILSGGAGADHLVGGAGEDRLYGQLGADRLNGEGGADTLDGGPGDDHLLGGDGDDLLLGGLDNDLLEGGVGDDGLYAGSGIDALKGGLGLDRLTPYASSPTDIYAYERIGSRLKVYYRNEPRSQSIPQKWNDRNKALLDYSPDNDYLADRRWVV